ncbi:MAG: hypothetical protein J0M19_06215 [Sphingomonadales bacterium]|nr:hypothetical protein [Sphingomonadales bacterium]
MFNSAFEADFEGLVESDFENDESDFGEAVRRRRPLFNAPRPGLRLPRHGNPTVSAPRGGVATKAELDATAKRLDDRIATSSAAIKALDGRTAATERELSGTGAALRKEIAIRKKETVGLKKEIDESRQIAMLMPLLGGGTDPVSKMLPFLLYSGMGSSSSGLGGSSESGGGNNMMMLMMMMIAMQPPAAQG